MKGVRWLRDVARNQFTLPFGEVVCEMKDGFSVALRPRKDEFERRIYYSKTYEPATLIAFERFIKPGDVVVDVGANLGLMTLKASQLVGNSGKVIAVEPNPEILPRLEANLRRNDVTNVTVRRFAMGAKQGQMTFYANDHVNIGAGSLVPGKRVVCEVKVETLDNILATERVAFLKIDVEGFEDDVIMGGLDIIRRDRPIIILEFLKVYSAERGGPFTAFKALMNLGIYNCFKFSDSKFSPNANLIEVKTGADLPDEDNILFVPKEICNSLVNGIPISAAS